MSGRDHKKAGTCLLDIDPLRADLHRKACLDAAHGVLHIDGRLGDIGSGGEGSVDAD